MTYRLRLRFLFFLVVLLAASSACSLTRTLPKPQSAAGQTVITTPTVVAETMDIPTRTDTPLPEPTSTLPSGIEPSPTFPDRLETLKNFSYWLEDFHFPAEMRNGDLVSKTMIGGLVEPVAFGDLNGDGQQDAAVILAIKPGELGTYCDLIVLLNQDGKLVQSGFAYLGDGQVVNHLEIANGRILLDGMTPPFYRLNPLCNKVEHRYRSYGMDAGVLRLAGEQVLDNPTDQTAPLPNEIMIESPGLGDPLVTPQQVSGLVGQVPPERQLDYRVTDLMKGLLLQGKVPVMGEPGEPGTFTFQIALDPAATSLVRVEIEDSTNSSLRGRSMVLLIGQENYGPCQSPFSNEYRKATGR